MRALNWLLGLFDLHIDIRITRVIYVATDVHVKVHKTN